MDRIQLDSVHIRVFLIIAVASTAVVAFCQSMGTVSVRDFFQPFSIVLWSLIGLLVFHNRRSWRWRWLHGWFVKRPDLRGTWLVKLQSDWINPKTGKGVPLIIGYMAVTQTLSTLQMRQMTKESESGLIAHEISELEGENRYQIVGVYNNEPGLPVQKKNPSPIHYGALRLYSHGPGNRPETLTGEYWTGRNTTGTMVLSDRHPEVFTRFDDAHQAFGDDRNE